MQAGQGREGKAGMQAGHAHIRPHTEHQDHTHRAHTTGKATHSKATHTYACETYAPETYDTETYACETTAHTPHTKTTPEAPTAQNATQATHNRRPGPNTAGAPQRRASIATAWSPHTAPKPSIVGRCANTATKSLCVASRRAHRRVRRSCANGPRGRRGAARSVFAGHSRENTGYRPVGNRIANGAAAPPDAPPASRGCGDPEGMIWTIVQDQRTPSRVLRRSVKTSGVPAGKSAGQYI